jgi:hypothetical protein
MTALDQEPVTERNPASVRSPCWQQELRSASAEAQRVTGEIIVLLAQFSEKVSELGICLVRLGQASELASLTEKLPNVSRDSNLPPPG